MEEFFLRKEVKKENCLHRTFLGRSCEFQPRDGSRLSKKVCRFDYVQTQKIDKSLFLQGSLRESRWSYCNHIRAKISVDPCTSLDVLFINK